MVSEKKLLQIRGQSLVSPTQTGNKWGKVDKWVHRSQGQNFYSIQSQQLLFHEFWFHELNFWGDVLGSGPAAHCTGTPCKATVGGNTHCYPEKAVITNSANTSTQKMCCLPIFLMHTVATPPQLPCSSTQPSPHDRTACRAQNGVPIVILVRTTFTKTFELWKKFSIYDILLIPKKACIVEVAVILLAQEDHSIHFSDSKADKFIHISLFLVFQISGGPYW